MSRPLQLISWQQLLQTRFPHLSKPCVAVLALYSFGMILARIAGLPAVALFLSKHLRLPFDRLRKRLAEFYKQAHAKSGFRQGSKRRDFPPAECFAPLLAWVLALWPSRYLPLALDVTNLKDRFHVLAVSVLVRGVGLPVAWKVLPAGVKDPWHPHWQDLLGRLADDGGEGWTVCVASDRGLESARLFGAITALGWHPLMRAKKGGKFRPRGWKNFYHLGRLVSRVGDSLYTEGCAYTGERMACTLLGYWEAGYSEPWLILTDLPPESAEAVWYGMRSWIEQGFKVIKGGGWDWQNTRMEEPQRVERLWLVMAVASLWVVALGVEDEVAEQARKEAQEQARRLEQSQQQGRQRQDRERRREAQRAEDKGCPGNGPGRQQGKRIHRVFRRGLAVLTAAWQRGEAPLPCCLHPEPWLPPAHHDPPLTEELFLSDKTYP